VYRQRDYVIVRCDRCGTVYGKGGRVIYFYVIKRRRESGGEDLCPQCRQIKRNPLRVFENAKAAFLRLVQKNNNVPPKRPDLPRILRFVIDELYGGYRAFKEQCGFSPVRKHSGYWREWRNLEAELRPLCERLGFFPPGQYLLAIKASSLREAFKYFGGAEKIARRLGYKLRSGYEADDGHYVLSYYEFAVDNLLFYHGVPHETFPSIREGDKRRGDFRVGDTFIEVAGFTRDGRRRHTRQYHKNLNDKLAVYADLGIEVVVIFKEDFGDIGLVVDKLRPLIKEYGDAGKQVDINNAIRPASWWSKWGNVKPLLQEVIVEIGRFPRARELEDMGRSCVAHYIMKYHGGFAEAKRRMGVEVRQEAPGYFADWGNVEKMFLGVCERLGYFPSAGEIRECRYGLIDCVSSLYKYWGSLTAVAAELGFPTKREYDKAQRRKSGWKPQRKPERELPSRQFQKECGTCGKEFRGRKHSLFCSRKCYQVSCRTREERICPVCGQRFEPSGQKVTTCSRSCGQKNRHSRNG